MPLRKSAPDSAPDRIEQAALQYLARRNRTAAQVQAYLSRRGASPARIRALIRRLQASGYLNDEAYAERWARTRVARRPMGRERLAHELLAQGLQPATVARTLDLVYRELSEHDLARTLLSRRSGPGRAASQARKAGLLRRYGFSDETIESVLDLERAV